MDTVSIIKICASAVVAVIALVMFFHTKSTQSKFASEKKFKRKKRLFFWIMIISVWFFCGSVINTVFALSGGISVEVEMFSERTNIFGLSVAKTTITSLAVVAVIFVLALAFRFIAFPKFKEKPNGLQNAVEIAVEFVDKYTNERVEYKTGILSSYMLAVALFMVGCAFVEFFGVRPPTSDLTVTFSLALVTFILINVYGIKKKKIGGRIKSLATPSVLIFPSKVLSDIAVPVSLACRLFGNMLGGMIVMDLLKTALGGYAVGVAPLAGLYFNLFHPIIQTYIFITLSLTFINEAVE